MRLQKIRIAIIGSRTATSENIEMIKKLIPKSCKQIVSGGAQGADSCAEIVARELGIELFIAKPQYKKFGRIATIIRNKLIVEMCDLVIAVWDTKSKGTLQVLKYAKQTKTDVQILTF